MGSESISVNRRKLLKTLTAGAALSLAPLSAVQSKDSKSDNSFPTIKKSICDKDNCAELLSSDESFWTKVAAFYDKADGIVNLEHGYWGKMSRPVQQAFIQKTEMVNTQLSFYARKHYADDLALSTQKTADLLGADKSEVVLTRNATEAVHNLISQYNQLTEKDAVLYTDIDYPSFKKSMKWLADSKGINAVEVVLPARASQKQILDSYIKTFDKHPNLKLMLLTHVSNQHGLILPVADIAKAAKERGIDVICDCAQSWGLVNFTIDELNVDWAAFNLHKWLGSPVGVGALYMKKGSLTKISPYPGESDPNNTKVSARVHTATVNFASILTVPPALEFHQKIGGENKQARLRYLRSLWVKEAEQMPHIEVLGGLDDESSTGMGAFREKGKTSLAEVKKLQKRLENEFGVFTVVRVGLASGCCIRVTPQVFTSPNEIGQLVNAMKNLV